MSARLLILLGLYSIPIVYTQLVVDDAAAQLTPASVAN